MVGCIRHAPYSPYEDDEDLWQLCVGDDIQCRIIQVWENVVNNTPPNIKLNRKRDRCKCVGGDELFSSKQG